jgi:hypothetical protein
MPESFLEYLHQRWEAGCRHGRTLFAEIRKLGYVGCYSGLAKFLSPWRQPKVETRKPIPASRRKIVDALKRQCPGFAAMRKLVFSFRAILREGGEHLPSLDGRGQDRYPFTGKLCPNFETGPKRSGSGCKRTMEQRPGRRTT